MTGRDELLDELEIRRLVMFYCRGVDRRDFDLVRSLYHEDAIDDHGAMFYGGPDAFVAWLPDAMAAWELTIHSVTNSVIVVDGDQAEGEHLVRAWHRTAAPDAQEYIVNGRYLDKYQRREGAWKFSHRSLVFDHGEIRNVDDAILQQMGAEAAHGCADRADPSWSLPLLSRLS